MEMPVFDGISILTYAFEQQMDDRLFTLWVWSKQCFEMSFDEFKRNRQPIVINEKHTLERLDELMGNTQWVRSD